VRRSGSKLLSNCWTQELVVTDEGVEGEVLKDFKRIKMLLPFDRIAQVTELALQQMPTLEVIGRVTIIRGYAQLLALDASYKEYEQKLAKALLELSSIASRSNQSELSRNVQTVVAAIDADSVS